MIRLFIDTSNSDVSVSCFKDGKVLSYINESSLNNHSVTAVPSVKKVLDCSLVKAEDVDEILVCNGPGSFTGIRIGLTIAKVYAYTLKKKIKLISSLRLLSLGNEKNPIISIIDARNDNYYFGVYDSDGNLLLDERFASKEELLQVINKYDNPLLVGYNEFKIDNYLVVKRNLDFLKINLLAGKIDEVNVHNANPNYLKLPSVLEHD